MANDVAEPQRAVAQRLRVHGEQCARGRDLKAGSGGATPGRLATHMSAKQHRCRLRQHPAQHLLPCRGETDIDAGPSCGIHARYLAQAREVVTHDRSEDVSRLLVFGTLNATGVKRGPPLENGPENKAEVLQEEGSQKEKKRKKINKSGRVSRRLTMALHSWKRNAACASFSPKRNPENSISPEKAFHRFGYAHICRK